MSRGGSGGRVLFRTLLEKALFSSPAACASTIRERIKRLSAKDDSAARADIAELEALFETVEAITPSQFSKFQNLLDLYSRKIVGSEVFAEENADNSNTLLQRAYLSENIATQRSPLVLHGDNGSPLKAATVLGLMHQLEITASHSRPRVSTERSDPFADMTVGRKDSGSMRFGPAFLGMTRAVSVEGRCGSIAIPSNHQRAAIRSAPCSSGRGRSLPLIAGSAAPCRS